MKKTRAEDVKEKEIEEFKKTYFEQIDKHTPKNIKELKIFGLDNPREFSVRLDSEKIKEWHVREWLDNYKKEAMVSTAGIRGVQNVLFPHDYRYPINELGFALATIGKARVLKKKIKDRQIHKICSGEIRYNTDRFIELIKRVQAAEGIYTHLPKNNAKTSIWMTSFLIFMNDYDGGEYVTSSHAISSKTATKDLDSQGSQFIPEMSSEFVQEIEKIVDTAEKEGFDIKIAPVDSEFLSEDLSGFSEYVEYLKKSTATDYNINLIKEGIKENIEIIIECVGGCMHPMLKEVFSRLGIIDAYSWNNPEHDPFFHGIGKTWDNPITQKRGFYDWGCDTTILEVVETMGYEKILADKPIGQIVVPVDPDGDRICIIQVEASSREEKVKELGIPYIKIGNNRIITIYTPNQVFFLNMNFHSEQLKEGGQWDDHPRFIITTTPSAGSWVEWAEKVGAKFLYVPVGFKEIATMMKKVEAQIKENPDQDVILRDIFGRIINLGVQPRLAFAGEESGGMIIGPEELITSKGGRKAIAMREKSATEASIIVSALACNLHSEKKLLSEYIEEIFDKYDIKRRYDLRLDIKFYDETEPDPEVLKKTKAEGEMRRDKADDFFLSIALAILRDEITLKQAKGILSEILPELDFSNLQSIDFVGDGTYFDFSDKFIEIRKSGTDAVIKCYASGQDKPECLRYAKAIGNYQGERTETHKKIIPEKTYKNCREIAIGLLREFQREGKPEI